MKGECVCVQLELSFKISRIEGSGVCGLFEWILIVKCCVSSVSFFFYRNYEHLWDKLSCFYCGHETRRTVGSEWVKESSMSQMCKSKQYPITPYTPPVGGGFVPLLFHLTVLWVRNRPSMGGPNGPVNIRPSEVVIKLGWGWSGACVQGNASMPGQWCKVVLHEHLLLQGLKPVKKR